ncbi:MAG: cell division protein FtsK, partial [Gammaproteobacteria bacterium]|nr:cell division protein FtsK [Gammaproteobacteria bacterium]
MLRGLREGAVILLGAVAVLLFAALVTWHPADPGFTFTGEGGEVRNLGGRRGAWLADTLYFLFGGPAYLFPVMLGAAAFWAHRRRDPEAEAPSRASTALRVGGFVITLVAACAIAALHFRAGELREGAGGVVGTVAGDWMLGNFNFVGGTLLLLAVGMAGLSLASGLSWLGVIDRLGGGFWGAIDWLRARRAKAQDVAEGEVRRAARKESVETETRRVASRPKPRIEAPAPQPEKSERIEKERQV